jgi:hypothetical protein
LICSKAHSQLWANKDPSAALSKTSGSTHPTDGQQYKHTPSTNAPSVFSRLDPLVSSGTERRQSHQTIPSATISLSEPVRPADINNMAPRTMAEIEAEMQAALRKQQLLAQQQEFERRQAEQQLLREQLLQQEERRLFEQEQTRIREQQALMQDPLMAIRQAMGETNGMMPPTHEPLQSIASGSSPLMQHRSTMSSSRSIPSASMGPMAPTQQDLIIQELLYQQQQQQQRFIQQQAQQQQHFDVENSEPVISTEAQLRMQEAEAKHRRRMAKIQSMVRYAISSTSF